MISFSQQQRGADNPPIFRIYGGDCDPLGQQKLTLREAYYQFKRRPTDSTRTVEAYENCLAHWEALTTNPDVRDVDCQFLEDFKDSFLAAKKPHSDDGYSPNTWKKLESHVMAILNRCGPRTPYNKFGRGIIDEVPVVEPVKRRKRPPRIATHEQVSSIYQACVSATWPRNPDVPAPLWWQVLVVWLFNIGSRRNDFLSLRWDQIDLERRIFISDEEKTGKQLPKPLNETVVAHLMRIRSDRELVFPKSKGNRLLYKHWYAIQERAGISREDRILFHEMRKTCCTAYYKKSPGGAQEMMGHGTLQTTRDSYWAPSDHLAELAQLIEQPSAFLETLK